MSDDIISQLQQATTDEQKTWIITEVTLKTLPTKLADAVRVAAIPHWFDVPVLAALLSTDTTEAEEFYQGIKALSFSESFGNLGYALHDLTRASILSHLVSTQSDFFQKLSQRAYKYFRQFEDAQNTAETIYHLLATDKTGGMEKFTEQIKNYIQTTNFSAANNLIRNAKELVKLGRLGGAESAEIDWQHYLVGQGLIKTGTREKAPEIKRQYAIQAFQVFNPAEDIGKYQQLEPPQILDKTNTAKKNFLIQRINEAKRLGDIFRQHKWLTELDKEEDYVTTLQFYNEILIRDENNKEAIAHRGNIYRRMGDYPAALADLNHALELEPDNAWILARRGATYSSMGDHPAALANLNRALELGPNDAVALTMRGETHRRMGDSPAALADFTRALELDPDYVSALTLRGETHRLLGDSPAALADFNRALELEPDEAWTIASRGQVYQTLERYDDALADFNRAIELDETLGWALASRGETHRRMGDSPAALADFNRALELEPDYAFALASRGETHRLRGDYPAALADFDRALDLAPDAAGTLALRGETHRLRGDYQSALADLNHAIELEPENDWSHYGRGLIFLFENRSEQAQTDFSLAIQQSSLLYEHNPEDWRNTFNLAIYHLAAEHVEEAECLYRKALTHSIPASNLREGIDDLNDFLCLFPDHPQAKAMRDLLQQRLDETSSC